jgi:hypothetical protein
VLTRWIAGLIALVIWAGAGATGEVAGPGDTPALEDTPGLEEVHAEWRRDEALQLERPQAEPEAAAPRVRREMPGWQRWLSDVLGAFFEAIGPVFRVLFYVLVAGIALAIIWFVLNRVFDLKFARKGRARQEIVESRVEDIRPDARRARTLLEEADALAREGQFAQAVHLLLFRSIEDIQERREGGLPRSLTAREIGALGALPQRARSALAPIIGVVEHSFFGGRDVDRSGWETARASYEEFAFGESWT